MAHKAAICSAVFYSQSCSVGGEDRPRWMPFMECMVQASGESSGCFRLSCSTSASSASNIHQPEGCQVCTQDTGYTSQSLLSGWDGNVLQPGTVFKVPETDIPGEGGWRQTKSREPGPRPRPRPWALAAEWPSQLCSQEQREAGKSQEHRKESGDQLCCYFCCVRNLCCRCFSAGEF